MANNSKISFRSFLGLLTVFGIQSCLYAEGHGRRIEKYAFIGQEVNLTCYSISNSNKEVTWLYGLLIKQDLFAIIYTCQNGQCNRDDSGTIVSREFDHTEATQRNDTSILSLAPSGEQEHYFRCKLGNELLQEYSVKSIDPLNIVPNCTVALPSNTTSGAGSVTLSCEVNSGDIDVNLTLEGIGLNVPDDSTGSSRRIKAKTLYFDDFNNVRNASCNAHFPGIDITPSCTYPNIIKAQYSVERNDIIVGCDDDSDVDQWRFYSSDGIEEDIKNRSWIGEGGRALLIQDISERDVGKVVVCRIKGDVNQTKGTIGFTVISKRSVGTNNSNSEDKARTPSARNPYFVLTLLFLSLWLITTGVGGVWLGCRTKRNKSGTTVIALASGNATVPNVDSDERETPLVNDGTGARGNPGTLNKNNSAHNPAFEPEINNTGENSRNRQSTNESHLYFTLEKSSPSPINSLLRAPTARWEQPDANPASLNHPQSSHWQGYENVGEPNKGATCSYDLGEYAEVGYQIQGKGPPDLGEYAEVGYQIKGKGPPDLSGRPSIRKKPGREKVKENDISSLYSKVNK